MLGVAALAAVAAAVTVTLQRHHGHPARDSVTAYIEQVNLAQSQLRIPLADVMLAYRDFSTARSSAAEARRLDTAARTLSRVHRRLAALPAPPEAQRLRSRILALVADETAITNEVSAFARFLPRFDAELRTLKAAARQFGASVSAIDLPAAPAPARSQAELAKAQASFDAASTAAAGRQADAVEAYDAALRTAAARLRRLGPAPAVFAPAYRSQLDALRSTATAGARLSAELRKTQRQRVAALSRAFAVAARRSQSLPAQRAQIAAFKAYNARVKSLGTATHAVSAELERLQRTLP